MSDERRKKLEEKKEAWKAAGLRWQQEEKLRTEQSSQEQTKKRRIDRRIKASQRKKQKREERKQTQAEVSDPKERLENNRLMSRIEQMEGIEFEKFMAALFESKGYSHVERTLASGDQGVDILLTTEDRKVAVQLKRQANPVGNSAVHAAYFGMAYYDADEAWVVTTSTFTPKAKEAARKTGVRLHGGSDIRRWLHESDNEKD